jgi:hypothetical protein
MVLNLRPKCANPSCAASFEWLSGGRLFRFRRNHVEPGSARELESGPSRQNQVGHFWLCEHCSTIYKLDYAAGRGIVILPLWPALPAGKTDMQLPPP